MGLCLLLISVGPAFAAKLDPAIYPNANIYRDPAMASSTRAGFAKVIREYCPGFGRGLVHFLNVDGQLIRLRKTWPTYLELAPGQHHLEMEFQGTASSIWGTWQGIGEVNAEFEPGKTYVVRYQRTATDAFRVWVEQFEGFESVDMTTTMCKQSEFPDKGLHQ
jgi:hypothetical protein